MSEGAPSLVSARYNTVGTYGQEAHKITGWV